MLLLDENLSFRLRRLLDDAFPGIEHVARVGLSKADHREVWAYARRHELTLVAKDSDFNDLAVLFGPPPHLVWVRRGNCSTREIAALLTQHARAIRALPSSDAAVLELR